MENSNKDLQSRKFIRVNHYFKISSQSSVFFAEFKKITFICKKSEVYFSTKAKFVMYIFLNICIIESLLEICNGL